MLSQSITCAPCKEGSSRFVRRVVGRDFHRCGGRLLKPSVSILKVAQDRNRDIHSQLYTLQLLIIDSGMELKEIQKQESEAQLTKLPDLALLALCYNPACYHTWACLASKQHSSCRSQNPAKPLHSIVLKMQALKWPYGRGRVWLGQTDFLYQLPFADWEGKS